MLIHCKRKSDAIFDGGVGGGDFSGHTLFVKDNIVTYTYDAFDERDYQIKAGKPLAVGRVVRGKYSVLRALRRCGRAPCEAFPSWRKALART